MRSAPPLARPFALALALGFLCGPGNGRARAEPLSIAIVSLEPCCPEQAWPEAERKTQAELDTLGYRVLLLPTLVLPSAATAVRPLDEIIRAERAFGGVRITRFPGENKGQAELWAQNPKTGKAAAKTIPLEETFGNRALSVVSLRISEALDACQLELGLPSPRLAARAGPVPSLRAWSIAAGIAGAASPGEMDLRPALEIALGWQGWKSLRLEWSAAASPLGAPLRSGGQSFYLGYAAAPLWVFWTWVPHPALRPALGLGGGPFFAWARIGESPQAAPQSRSSWTSYLALGARLGWAVSERLALQLGLRLATLAPNLSFQLEDQTLARVQGPLIEALTALSCAF